MRFFLILLLAFSAYAEEPEQLWSKEIAQSIVKKEKIEKIEKIDKCVVDYIDKQSNTYAKVVQQNLYELLHNLDNMAERIQGKKSPKSDISYKEK